MRIDLRDGLSFVSAVATHRKKQVNLDNILLDTGSAATILSVDRMLEIGLKPERENIIERMFGVGGIEFVVSTQIDGLEIGGLYLGDFEIQIGTLQYGLELDGIIGLDFLIQTKAIIDLGRLEINPAL